MISSIYEKFFQLSSDAQCIVDFDGHIEAVNGAFAEHLGYSTEELAHFLIFDLAHQDDRDRLSHEHALAQNGAQAGFLCALRSKNGTHRKLLLRATPSPPDRRILFVIRTTAMDIQPSPGKTSTFFSLLTRQLVTALEVEHAFIFRWMDSPVTRVQTLSAFIDGQIVEGPLEFPLAGTPCEIVARGRSCYYTEDIRGHFPEDQFVIDYPCESYLGVPFFGPGGKIIGHICTFGRKRLTPEDAEHKLQLLSDFAQQTATEIDRMRAQEAFGQVMLATASLSGEDIFREFARHIAEACQTRIAVIAEYVDQPPSRIRSLACWTGDDFFPDLPSDRVAGTPSERLAQGQTCYWPQQARLAYPDAQNLAALSVEGYYGVPLLDASSVPIGEISVMDVHPLERKNELTWRLELFSVRVASELLRIRSERRALAHQKRYQIVMENAADPLFVCDTQGEILEVNRAAEKSLGVSRDKLVGTKLALVHVEADAAWIGRELDSLRNGPITLDATLRRSDGSTFPVEMRTVLLHVDGRDLLLSLARDITERKRIQELSEASLHALSTPIIEVWDGVVALPVIGNVNRDRAVRMMETLLHVISSKSAEFAIVDLTGVTAVDAATASHLLDIAKSASLLGSRCLLSGISAKVAQSMISLDAEVHGLTIFGTLQSALRYAITERAGRRRGPSRMGAP
jgi:PAS domain S-box-containing protein